ncbi:Protein phosphatase PP2A regulatory subunit B [Thoreauomyces humboldtii]|nr:Protein phosphatase PP2A regulatory subunit B [Thoreauomyces humboldtii]
MADALETYPTLYISGLLPSITEFDLVTVLNSMQMESKVGLERDPDTMNPLGRVMFIFRYLRDAERFFATVNGSMFLGAKVHVTFRDPNMNFTNTSGAKSLLCKHVPLGITSLAFHDLVRMYGRIISCKVLVDRSGTEAYALLQYERQESADECLEELNGTSLNGNVLALTYQFVKNSPYQYPTQRTASFSAASDVSFAQPSPPASPPPPPTLNRQSSTSRPNPRAPAFSPTRAVLSGATTTPPQTPPIRHAWETAPAPAVAPLDCKNLYVKNLEDHVDNTVLFELFRPFGRISSARVMREDGAAGASKGFGFVAFEDAEMAARAIKELNGRPSGAKTLVVNVAEPKGYRLTRLASYHAK